MEVFLIFLLFFSLIIFIFAIVNWTVDEAEDRERLKRFIGTTTSKKETRLQRLQRITFARIDEMDGHTFENFVGDLLTIMGYQAKITKGSGDFGVDVIAEKDNTKTAIQVKRANNRISRRAVSDAVAGKLHYKCNKAMVLTNNFFTKDAIQFAKSVGCELIDRDRLTQWISTYSPNLLESEPKNRETQLLQEVGRNQKNIIIDILKERVRKFEIPQEIVRRIKDQASKNHPNDYSTQLYVLEEEMDAYRKLVQFSTDRISSSVLKSIKDQTSKDHPNDYSTQLYVLEEEIDAYCKLGRPTVHPVSESDFQANQEMRIPIKQAINSSNWYHCQTNSFVDNFEDGDDIDFKLRVISFEKINLEEVDRPDKIQLDITAGILWFLQVEIVNLWKKILSSYPFHDAIILIDQDNFEFRPVADGHLTMFSEYAKKTGLNLLNGWSGSDRGELIPKIPLRGALAFLLPNDEKAEYSVSVEGGKIKEA